jgi:hypothetical protein
MIASRVISGVLLSLLPAVAFAQDFSATFWLARDSRSATDCMAFDPQFTREHRLTVRGRPSHPDIAGRHTDKPQAGEAGRL